MKIIKTRIKAAFKRTLSAHRGYGSLACHNEIEDIRFNY